TDRAYWEDKSTPEMLRLTDRIIELVNKTGVSVGPKYNKYYVGLQRNGLADNFISFHPRKNYVTAGFRIDRSDTLDDQINEWGLPLIKYDTRSRRYEFRFTPSIVMEFEQQIKPLVRRAHGRQPDLSTEETRSRSWVEPRAHNRDRG